MSIQEERLQRLLKAEEKILKSQEYKADGVSNRRADLAQVRAAIDDLISAGVGSEGRRSRRVILKDY